MKCPKCGKEMEDGRLVAHGGAWQKKGKGWMENFFAKPFMHPQVTAWRCPECKKVELISD